MDQYLRPPLEGRSEELTGSSLEKTLALRPVSYTWNDLHDHQFGENPGPKYGFIAQEVADTGRTMRRLHRHGMNDGAMRYTVIIERGRQSGYVALCPALQFHRQRDDACLALVELGLQRGDDTPVRRGADNEPRRASAEL